LIRFIFIMALILSVAYMNVRIFVQTEKNKNRDILWFMVAVADIIGTIIIIKTYNSLAGGIDLQFSGAAEFLLMFIGYAALILISIQLIVLLSRHGARKRGTGLVLTLDLIIGVVLYLLFRL
jgi:hypothetical protein